MGICDRVAVITGGTGNLGGAVTRRFLSEGAMAAIGYHVAAGWRMLQSELPADLADRCIGVQVDVTDEEQVARLIETTLDAFGRIDILLNLVGAFNSGRKLWETDRQTWQEMMELNLTSAFLCARHALPAMLEAGRGRIVNVSSKACLDLQPGAGAYAVAKGALLTLTRALREELKGTGVTANAIMPGIIDTPVTRKLMPKADPDRWVTPEEIAGVLVALCGEECDPVSGTVLRLFGDL